MSHSQVSYGETKDSAVDKNMLCPSSRTVEAEWIEDRLAPFGSCVSAIVPDGFEAYVRIFHPATERNNERIRWADVAAKSCRTMHRLAQFHAINRPQVSDVDPANGPDPGELPPDLLTALCGALATHTTSPQSCFFCLWEGYDWRDSGGSGCITFTPLGYSGPPPPLFENKDSVSEIIRTAVASEVRVRLPHRDHLMFEGPLEGATELPRSPNLFWPEDRGWCVVSEIDLYCTLVGGTNGLAESITANPALEAWRVFPDDPISYYSDKINV